MCKVNNFDLVKKTLKEAQSIDQKLSVISKKNMYKDTIEVIDMNDYSILNFDLEYQPQSLNFLLVCKS